MKIRANYSNTPKWRNITVKTELPGELKKLEEMSRNLWWVWNSEGKQMFRALDPDLWRATGENPVLLLQKLSPERVDEIINDKEFVSRIQRVYDNFKAYMAVPMREDLPSVSYFSMEYGLCNALKIYSGGLGVLAGDYIKEASDYRINMTAVGFLYRHGYFTQTISMDGHQVANYEPQNFNQLPLEPVMEPDGRQMVVEVPYPGRIIYANVWRVNVGRMKLYLLDTDLDRNSEWDRSITSALYGGDWENRIKQEFLLGIGGVLMLKKLGVKSQLYHCNEGHAALLNLQRLVDYVQGEGLSFNEAMEMVRATSLYTVHTPVPAGHDSFDNDLFYKYMNEFPAKLGIEWNDLMNMGREDPDTNTKFSMSVFALNTCQESNGVSWLHGEVSKRMFKGVWKGYAAEESHVSYVTNGVHMPPWAASEWKEFYAKKLGKDYINNQAKEATWAAIQNVPDEEIWAMRMTMKNKFINFVRRDFRATWLKNQGDPQRVLSILDKINPNALLIGFARRFATYKRAHLLFTDLERLKRIVNNEQFPVQFIFAGKAHPADGGGQELIRRIVEISKMPEFQGKIIFLENYDMVVAKRLVSGVDIWLNTPTRPLEASGTSGEKAEMNGVLNFSVLDGWWYEGYREGAGWALTDKRTFTDQSQQDQLDAATIYKMLETEIIPLYFAKNSMGYSPLWVQFIKNSICKIAPNFTMTRMMDDYLARFYQKEAKRSKELAANGYALAKKLAAWKEEVASKWDDISVVEIKDNLAQVHNSECRLDLQVVLNTAGLGTSLGVDLVAYQEIDGEVHFDCADELKVSKVEGDIVTYTLNREVRTSGVFRYAYRVYPVNEHLPHRQDFAYIKWI